MHGDPINVIASVKSIKLSLYKLGVVSAEALATVNVGVIAKLYTNKKEGERPAFNHLRIKLNQLLRYGMEMVHLIY